MKVLVTGATGLIGNAVSHGLVARGHQVRALVRDPARARPILPEPEPVELLAGDITDPDQGVTLRAAVEGMDWVFHAAGMPEQWQRDERIFDRVNRAGTANVAEAALAAGVTRFIHLSTMDVFAAPTGGTVIEDNVDPIPSTAPTSAPSRRPSARSRPFARAASTSRTSTLRPSTAPARSSAPSTASSSSS